MPLLVPSRGEATPRRKFVRRSHRPQAIKQIPARFAPKWDQRLAAI